jgi:hypothetical protein
MMHVISYVLEDRWLGESTVYDSDTRRRAASNTPTFGHIAGTIYQNRIKLPGKHIRILNMVLSDFKGYLYIKLL